MIVSDTSPLNYLILIRQINLLPQLYRGLRVIGTLGVLATAHERGLLDLTEAIDLLRQTFHVSPRLLASILSKYQSK